MSKVWILAADGFITSIEGEVIDAPIDEANQYWNRETRQWEAIPIQPLPPDTTVFPSPPATPQPRWNDLLSEFISPGNPLYVGIDALVGESGQRDIQTHWDNVQKIFLLPEVLRVPSKLSEAILYLQQLLAAAQKPITSDQISAWNALVTKYQFPDSCKLS